MAYAQALPDTCLPQRSHLQPAARPPAGGLLRRSPRRLIQCPARPRNAGSSVTAATAMIPTMTEVAMPADVMNGMPATAMPRIAMTTAPPANTTARPDVATARPTDSSMPIPRARNSR